MSVAGQLAWHPIRSINFHQQRPLGILRSAHVHLDDSPWLIWCICKRTRGLHLINKLSLSVGTSLCCQDTFTISFEKEVSTEPLPTTSPTVPDPRLGTTSLYWLSWWWTGNDEIRALRDWVWGTNHPFVVVQEEAIITPRSDMRWLWWWWCGGVSEDPFIHRSLFHWGVYYLLLLYVVLLSDRYNITQDIHRSL